MSTRASVGIGGNARAREHKRGRGTEGIRAVVVQHILYQKVKFVKENLSGSDSGGQWRKVGS